MCGQWLSRENSNSALDVKSGSSPKAATGSSRRSEMATIRWRLATGSVWLSPLI